MEKDIVHLGVAEDGVTAGYDGRFWRTPRQHGPSILEITGPMYEIGHEPPGYAGPVPVVFRKPVQSEAEALELFRAWAEERGCKVSTGWKVIGKF